jgi:hypothetical protein
MGLPIQGGRFSQREEEERLNNSLRVIFTESNPLGAQTA